MNSSEEYQAIIDQDLELLNEISPILFENSADIAYEFNKKQSFTWLLAHKFYPSIKIIDQMLWKNDEFLEICLQYSVYPSKLAISHIWDGYMEQFNENHNSFRSIVKMLKFYKIIHYVTYTGWDGKSLTNNSFYYRI